MKLAWVTDLHIDAMSKVEKDAFYQQLSDIQHDQLLVTGDIADSSQVKFALYKMLQATDKPINFVLGNHDYHNNWIEHTRDKIATTSDKEYMLNWLPTSGPVEIDNKVFLVGQDGWADGRTGDQTAEAARRNDQIYIEDFKKLNDKPTLFEKMRDLADIDAINLKKDINTVTTQTVKKIIILTHVPPFAESCLLNNKISPTGHLPYFVSTASGKVISAAALANPQIQFLVLCGHTHHASHYQPYNNLTVKVGINREIRCY